MSKKECIAMLLAGGQGSRLGALTQKIAKPAVSFGGKFRIIDFSLSNCSNSGIDTVGVLTQYRPYLLHAYASNAVRQRELARLYACQISSRYSRMVRSLENQPLDAVLSSALRFQVSWSP